MNTHVNIRARLQQFSQTFVTLLIVGVGLLVLGGRSVQAQTPATVVDSSITIVTNGTVVDSGVTVNVN